MRSGSPVDVALAQQRGELGRGPRPGGACEPRAARLRGAQPRLRLGDARLRGRVELRPATSATRPSSSATSCAVGALERGQPRDCALERLLALLARRRCGRAARPRSGANAGTADEQRSTSNEMASEPPHRERRTLVITPWRSCNIRCGGPTTSTAGSSRGASTALAVMRDAETFTVDDPRFATARVVGPSMLSLEGAEHARHRAPFAARFRRDAILRELGAGRARGGRRPDRGVRRRRGRAAAGVRRAAGGADDGARARHRRHADRRRPALVRRDRGGDDRRVARGASPTRPGARGVRRARRRHGPRGRRASSAAEAASQRRRPALRRHRDDGGDDPQRRLAPAPARALRRATSRRCCPAPSRSRCASSPPRRSSTATPRATSARRAPGDKVVVSIRDANRDPDAFAGPRALRPDARRTPSRHLAFAAGPHVCLGHAPGAPGGAHGARAAARPDLELVERDSSARRSGVPQAPRSTGARFGVDAWHGARTIPRTKSPSRSRRRAARPSGSSRASAGRCSSATSSST